MSALFAGLVLNHTQMALLLLGRAPHPQTGETVQDLGGARMLIDQLEMLDQKTRGNLQPQETQMLRESLTALRMAFVEAANGTSSGATPDGARAGTTAKPQPEPPGDAASRGASSGAAEQETHKKFSKKYSS